MIKVNSNDSMADVLSVLSKEGSIKILDEASSKLISRRKTPNEIGLSKRQYYSRIRGLKNNNLIVKEGEGYVLTDTGKKVRETVKNLYKTLDVTRNSKNFDVSLSQDNQNGIILTYEELVERTVEIFENSSEEVFLATKYIDHRVAKKILEKNENIEIKMITHKFELTKNFELYKALLSPGALKKAYELAKNHTKVIPSLPYTFIISDQKEVLYELKNPIVPDEFFGAFYLQNNKLAKKLRNVFNELFNMSEITPVSNDESIPNERVLSSLSEKE
ncbi:hypothetical protein AKJ38_02390 [candidate division MSBL1 archaeon SCGC-AAA259I14]|uniref:Uncharacterized protein n=1 Tax=candidate division MSBL1 archaeon SCGC-AAA259I14 TaxID=1698268 RepID=A0A133URR8_9EURY|nr:hypothetical protein AKJ38_02390 [candidate division MSBL1 archaeon SCGC-AAA259I14]